MMGASVARMVPRTLIYESAVESLGLDFERASKWPVTSGDDEGLDPRCLRHSADVEWVAMILEENRVCKGSMMSTVLSRVIRFGPGVWVFDFAGLLRLDSKPKIRPNFNSRLYII